MTRRRFCHAKLATGWHTWVLACALKKTTAELEHRHHLAKTALEQVVQKHETTLAETQRNLNSRNTVAIRDQKQQGVW